MERGASSGRPAPVRRSKDTTPPYSRYLPWRTVANAIRPPSGDHATGPAAGARSRGRSRCVATWTTASPRSEIVTASDRPSGDHAIPTTAGETRTDVGAPVRASISTTPVGERAASVRPSGAHASCAGPSIAAQPAHRSRRSAPVAPIVQTCRSGFTVYARADPSGDHASRSFGAPSVVSRRRPEPSGATV